MKSKTLRIFKEETKHLLPSYFALVMATGIVSIGADLFEIPFVGRILFYFNLLAYGVLMIATLFRISFYLHFFRRDFWNGSISPGFLTIVAATTILGYQFILFLDNYWIAGILFYLGLILWSILIYTLFTVIIIRRNKSSLERGISGIWLLIVVATESICVLGTVLSGHLGIQKELLLFISLIFFLVGCTLYLILITLIFYRLAFFRIVPEELAPAYWINMGAVAIITLAGTSLIHRVGEWSFLLQLKNFLVGFTLLFWASGTWWIPLLIFLGIWRYWFRKVPFRYHPQSWGMVFPLGMYAVCTHHLLQVTQIDFLSFLPNIFLGFALLAWSITFIGFFINFFKRFFV